MKMHASNHHTHGADKSAAHQFAINGTGTLISIQFPPAAAKQYSGVEAKALRELLSGQASKGAPMPQRSIEILEFLNRCELRSEEEAAALGQAPPESDAGKGKRIDLGDGTHAYANTEEEEAALSARALENHHRIHADTYAAREAAAPIAEGDHSDRGE